MQHTTRIFIFFPICKSYFSFAICKFYLFLNIEQKSYFPCMTCTILVNIFHLHRYGNFGDGITPSGKIPQCVSIVACPAMHSKNCILPYNINL